MVYFEYLHLVGALLSFCLGIAAVVHNHRSLSRWCFAVGMFVPAGEQVCSFLSAQGSNLAEILGIQTWSMILSSFLPAPWLAFSLIYGRENPKESLARWKSLLAISLVIPFLLAIFPSQWPLLAPDPRPGSSPADWNFPVGKPGFALFVYQLLVSVFIVSNLERILRASIGAIRWRIKFYILGVILLFAARIYTSAQVILFSSFSSSLLHAQALSLIAADSLIILGLIRGAREEIRFYISQEFMNHSITLLAVGSYLLFLGIVYELSTLLKLFTLPFLNASMLIIACVGTIALLSSNHFRHGVRAFVQTHFQHPRYDYQKIWWDFVHRTSHTRTERDLANITARLLSEIFAVSSVSIWLWDEKTKVSRLIGTTSLLSSGSGSDSASLSVAQQEISYLMHSARHATGPMNLTRTSWQAPKRSDAISDIENPMPAITCCAPLLAGTRCLGLITLNSRFNHTPFDGQDFRLLDILARQMAGILYTKMIGQELEQARQMHAFQALSAFFVHDLKNVATSLSLTLQNLPLHYDNPEFREDALQLLAKGVEKINTMCAHLSFFKEGLKIQKTPADLNQIIIETLSTLDAALRTGILQEPSAIPLIPMDKEAIQKVVLNLLLNAWEAASQREKPGIILKTTVEGDFVVLSISDNGCGMTEEFMENSLFQPFQTTKKKGLGIGLYQCRQIVEAHGGKIEATSRQNSGSTFSVFLPITAHTV